MMLPQIFNILLGVDEAMPALNVGKFIASDSILSVLDKDGNSDVVHFEVQQSG